MVSSSAVVSALLGDLQIEANKGLPTAVDAEGRVRNGSEWAQQFRQDILGLDAIDAGSQLLEYVRDHVALVFTEFRVDFLAGLSCQTNTTAGVGAACTARTCLG